jgi:hypothetical protein
MSDVFWLSELAESAHPAPRLTQGKRDGAVMRVSMQPGLRPTRRPGARSRRL